MPTNEKAQLIIDEGKRLFPYICPTGYLTIGIGRNLETNGLTADELKYILTTNPGRKQRFYEHKDLPAIQLFKKLIEDFKKYGINDHECDYLFENDVEEFKKQLFKKFPWLEHKEPEVKKIMLNMAFNMGVEKLSGFTKTINLIKDSEYEKASEEMLKSRWAKQTKDRAKRLSKRMYEINKWTYIRKEKNGGG